MRNKITFSELDRCAICIFRSFSMDRRTYHSRVAECLTKVAHSSDQRDKQVWLAMALAWMRLAEQVDKSSRCGAAAPLSDPMSSHIVAAE
jgi:hypothetical protein